LHRPEKRNALNADVVVASTMRWRVRPSDEGVRVMLIHGAAGFRVISEEDLTRISFRS